MLVSDGVTRRRCRRAVRAALIAVAAGSLLGGCAGGPGHQAAPPPPGSAPSAVVGPGGGAGDPDTALCRAYLGASGDAHAPLPAMRTEKVLVAAVDFIELGANQIATRAAAGARSPVIAAAMRDVVAAQEDLDAQGHRQLPAGADLNATTVTLNPDRLAAALDTADLACKPVPGR